ncbi:MAG TPA: VCBS repeat-containing protein, partial [Ohtaekwangia sp.]|nr:VCBS repeat-containing protein [Ohtaekwangia sp.]
MMRHTSVSRILLAWMAVFALHCQSPPSSHDEMIMLLDNARQQYNRFDNYYAPEAQLKYYDSLIRSTTSKQDMMAFTYPMTRALIALGREEEAVPLLEEQVARINREGIKGMNKLKVQLALAYLRAGERANCVANHSPETCILPIQGSGIHTIPEGSQNAIKIYEELIAEFPENLEYRWLLNIAYMTLGEYPDGVPPGLLLPGLDRDQDSTQHVKPFQNIAASLGLDVNNMAGGVIVDDFDNDGYLDLVTSSWDLSDAIHYFRNNGDGTFADRSDESRLSTLTGGLNLLQADYNNDGFTDIFVLRGAWLRGNFCKQPNSLIKNNGDGTFTDVTTKSGLLSFHPTQTATWNDFNNDGWLDIFIGNETWEGNASSGDHPSELYINNRDETFTNIAKQAGCEVLGFVKGVTSGDYDNDGWKDIFVSTLSGKRYLFRNQGRQGMPSFEDVTAQSGIAHGSARTFPAWFWDYDND